MRSFKGFFPNFTLSLAAALLVVVILDRFNPRLGLLQGAPGLVLIVLTCVCSMVSGAALYIAWRREKK